MRASRQLAAQGTLALGAAVLTGLIAAAAMLGPRQGHPMDPSQTGGFAVAAAAYRAQEALEAGREARIPHWRLGEGDERLTTGIAVFNPGRSEQQVELRLLDMSGQELTCGGCTTLVPAAAGHLFWLPDLKVADPSGQPVLQGEATVFSGGPIIAAAIDVPLGVGTDHSLQGGISVGGELVPPTTPQQPLVLNLAKVAGVDGAGAAELFALNLDHQQPVLANATYFPWDGTFGPAQRFEIEPGRAEYMPLAVFSSVPPDAYAVVVSGQGPLGLVSRHTWPDRQSVTVGEAVWHDGTVTLPLVMKDSAGRCTTVAVRNTSAVSSTVVTAEVRSPAGGAPEVEATYEIGAMSTAALDLCGDRRFDKLPSGFVGSMVLRSSEHPVSAEALIAYREGYGLAEYGASATWMPGAALLVPLLHSAWSYEPGAGALPTYESRVYLYNPSRSPASVVATYVGVAGDCLGKSFGDAPVTMPGFGSAVLAPGPMGTGLLPAGCLAAGRIEVANGEIMAVVLDEGSLEQAPPTRTPTEPLPTPTATEPATPTASEVPPTEPATFEASPSATATEPGPETTPRATATFWPTRTPPPQPPRDPVPQVPAGAWHRVNRRNSLLPYDQVRFLEVDSEGSTWLRLRDPRGGPDTIVTAGGVDGVWETYRGGLRALVSTLPTGTLDRLGSVRDFFDRDGRGRIWIGPEAYSQGTWQVFSTDDSSPVGAVHYEGRVLLDAQDRGWVPLRATGDCIPPAACGNSAVRVFAPDGSLAHDLQLGSLSNPPIYGLDHVHLVARGGSHGPGELLRAALPALAEGRLDSVRGPAAAAQAGGEAAWVVAADKYYALPGTEPGYYPFLDPREFLATGLRNSGYATSATLSPSGLLQVMTWVELDLGSRVEHRILLNTLHDSAWEVEDLSDAGLFGPNLEFERVVGMDYCVSGELWLVTAAGAVAVRSDGERTDGLWTTYAADQGLFDPGDLPTDIGCGHDGSIWIGSLGGLLGYGFDMPPVRIYAPFTSTGHG